MNGVSFRRLAGFSAAGALLLALALPVTEASAATSPATVTVPATQPWTDTGISLPAGTVSFKASGTINVSGGDPQFDETPNGDGPADPTCIAGPNEYSGSWTAPGLPCWSLIGRIGNGTPFLVGDSDQVVAKTPGELYLGVNDETDFFSDNSGSWTVQVTWTSSSPSCTYTPTVTFSPSSGSVGTTFTITGAHWAPGGTVTSTLPYGSPGWFTGYQTPTVDANGGFSFKETVGTGPKGPTPPGEYSFTYVENYGGCSLKFSQTFTVTWAYQPGNYAGKSGMVRVVAYKEPDLPKYDDYCGPGASQVLISAWTNNVPSIDTLASAEKTDPNPPKYGTYISDMAAPINNAIGKNYYADRGSSGSQAILSNRIAYDILHGHPLITGIKTGVNTTYLNGWKAYDIAHGPVNHIITIYGFDFTSPTHGIIYYMETSSSDAGTTAAGPNVIDYQAFWTLVYANNDQLAGSSG